MPVVDLLIRAPRVVEEGKEGDQFGIGAVGLGNTQPIFHHPGPVDDPVVSPLRQNIACEDRFQNFR